MCGFTPKDLLSGGFERAVSLRHGTEESNRCMSTVQAAWCTSLSTWADMIIKLVLTDSLGLKQESM